MEFDGVPFVEPSPDEDAWEAYLGFAMERLGDDRASGLTNAALAELEGIIGCRLPFEVGMLLVMGQPESPPWVQWDDDPAAVWASWNAGLVDDLAAATDHGLWLASWGEAPGDAAGRRAVVEASIAASPLFPLWGRCAVPLAEADGEDSNDANPVLSVQGATVVVAGVDLAAWMHNRFGIPLPTWQPVGERRFPLWSELVDRTLDDA